MKKYTNKFLYYVLGLSSVFLPSITSAFSLKDSTFKSTIDYIRLDFIAVLLPILSALAFIFFFWGLSKFILNANKPEEIKKGREYMIWGVLALFVLLSWKAIISIISRELEIGDGKQYPVLPTDGVSASVSTSETFRSQ
jgi:hypothetical protein